MKRGGLESIQSALGVIVFIRDSSHSLPRGRGKIEPIADVLGAKNVQELPSLVRLPCTLLIGRLGPLGGIPSYKGHGIQRQAQIDLLGFRQHYRVYC